MFDLKTEILDSHEAILTIEFDDKTERRALSKAARQISREINIPGFRKGKVPPNVIIRMFGEEVLMQEAADKLMKNVYPKALDEADIEPYAPGQIEDVSRSPLRVTVRVPLMPEVDLGDYEDLRMERESVEITEEEMSKVLDDAREEHAILEPVDRPGAEDDVMLLSLIEAEVDDEIIVHDHDVEVVLDPEQEFLAPGIIEALIGLEAEEETSFVLTLPADFEDEELAGKEVTITVYVEQIYDRTLPELDDALASTIGNFETVDELKSDLRQRMREHKEAHVREAYHEALIDALLARADLRYPPIMIEEELDDMLDQIEENVERTSDMDWEIFLDQIGASEDELREDLRVDAVENVERGLVLSEFAHATGVEVSDDEIRAEMRELFAQRGIDNPALVEAMKFNSGVGVDIRAQLLGRKTLRRLERLAQGLPMEEPEPETEAASVEEQAEPEAEAPEVDTTADEVHIDPA